MEFTKFANAKAYVAPKHNGCVSYRLQGLDTTSVKGFWVGMSHFLPGGGAEMDASPFEKVYVVTVGEITVRGGNKSVVLKQNDSCVIPANEPREVANDTHLPASMVVILSTSADNA